MTTELTEHDWMPDRYPHHPDERPEHKELRVVGPPGCGKTSYVAQQVRENAIPKYGGGRVVLCSLTRAAAAEIAGRETGVPKENVGTLHAHCYRALERPKIAETGEAITRWNEWCGTAGWRMDPARVAADKDFDAEGTGLFQGGDLLAQTNVLRQRMLDHAMWPPHLLAFHTRWTEFKDENNLLDFTDMIETCLAEKDHHPALPEVIMADEAQDMSRLEMALLRKWGERATSLVLVGDPDQSLYTWRGADPASVFGTDPEGVIVRSQGFRVPEAIRAWASDWVNQIHNRLPVEYLARHEDPGNLESPIAQGALEYVPYRWNDPAPLVAAAMADADQGKTVMILTSCSYMLAPTLHRLRALGVPFHNPYRVKQGAWNPLAGATRGGRQHRVLSFLKPHKEYWGDEAGMWTWDDVQRWMDPMLARRALARGAKGFVEAKNTPDRFGETRADQEAPYNEVMQLLKDDEARMAIATGDIDWWHSALNDRDRKSQRYPIKVLKRRGVNALRDKPKIIVGTIHSVKGGEADVVYVCPDLSQAGHQAHRAGLETEGYASSIRLFYVAATRARHTLKLCKASDPELAVSFG